MMNNYPPVEKLRKQWEEHIKALEETGLFRKLSTRPNLHHIYQEKMLPSFISRKTCVLALMKYPDVILTIGKPFWQDEWFLLVNDESKTWSSVYFSFEEILELLPSELQSEMLFHLNLFR